jgi:hydroxymethylpyrimidine/phosphomethylpyrimidine kinase
VVSRFDLPALGVISQVDAVLDDRAVAAVKTGMLATAAVVKALSAFLAERGVRNLVVDPVVLSSSGQRLLDAEAVAVMAGSLLPLAAVFTPNLHEASLFCGEEISGVEGMRKAARKLLALGPTCVVVKGGHLAGKEATDIFYDGKEMLALSSPRVETEDDHGTGCVFSAAVAARRRRTPSPPVRPARSRPAGPRSPGPARAAGRRSRSCRACRSRPPPGGTCTPRRRR